MFKRLMFFVILLMSVAACDEILETTEPEVVAPDGETATVVRVIDGDTIDVLMNGQRVRVRYVGVNTPERDEVCYDEATQANEDLVSGKTITMVADTTDEDVYGRLLRYIYADGVLVNESLVRNGYAEAVLYEPDDLFYADFLALEKAAASDNLNCHATGIFDDGSDVR